VSLIHTAFYTGTFIGTFTAQHSVRLLGAKTVITLGLVVISVCSWAIPLAVYYLPHYSLTAALRLLTGISAGLFIPAGSTMLAKWFAQEEKSSAMAIFTVGNQFGIGVAMYSTAELCKVDFFFGWPTSFLLYGYYLNLDHWLKSKLTALCSRSTWLCIPVRVDPAYLQQAH
jgi:MFS family permease